jgi:hypothetical protein
MPSSELRGPYKLTTTGIDAAVRNVSAGTYALGETIDGTFHIHYVGRADYDVSSRLKDHVPKWYPDFKFEYYGSALDAFEKECQLYHAFNPPDNEMHPARPANTYHQCPCCNALG